MKRKIKSSLIDFLNDKLHTPTWLFLLLLVILVLRIPSFFEPYSYGDEMIYLNLGEAIRRGIPLYKDVHDNKPPMLYMVAGLAGNLFWFKAILAIWNLITIYIFWKLSEALFPKSENAQKIATAVFAILTTIPLLEGNIANAEVFMVGPTILAFLFLLSRKNTKIDLLAAGGLFSIASLFKIPAAFEIPTIVFFWIYQNGLSVKNLKSTFKKSLYVFVGFAIPVGLTLVWYATRGAFKEYLIAAFLQNVGYLSSWRPDDVQKSFLIRNFPLLLRAFIVFVGIVLLYLARKKLSGRFMFATVWLLLSLFAVTLSERPYPHYLIQSVPPISILISILVTHKTKEQVLSIIPLTAAFLVPVYFNFWHYPTLPYYERFVRLATKQISTNDYLSTFGGEVPRNYKVAGYIISATKPSDKIFVWGDSSPIYALTKRLPPIKYVADYHIKDFSSDKEIAKALSSDLPELVVILPNSSPLSNELQNLFARNYGLLETIEGTQIWKLLNPQVRSLLSP